MINAGNTVDEARIFAEKLSLDNPGKYVTLYACFGIFAEIKPRLHVYAPHDSRVTNTYWLNGSEYEFTESQHGAAWRAMPSVY